MKLLITLLSSNGLIYLKESYKSLETQLPVDFEYDIVIIINTLNNNYYNKVINDTYLKHKNIIRTESNGNPGKGHNSVINYFKNNNEYDYLFMIDGDDFVYPWAFQRLEHYLKYEPDILCLMFHDLIKLNTTQNKLYYNIKNKNSLITHNNSESKDGWFLYKGVNPFKNPIFKCGTPGRIVLLSKKSLSQKITYDENVSLFDDFYPFLQLTELSLLHKLNVFLVCDSDIYIYNTYNGSGATNVFFKDDSKFLKEEHIFRKSVENKFLSIQDFDLTKIPILELPKMDNENKKIKYITKLFDNIQIS